MAVTVIIDGTEYLLLHVAQPRVNGGKCNRYEVRTRDERGDYHQKRDIYVPLGRSLQSHMQAVFGEPDDYAA